MIDRLSRSYFLVVALAAILAGAASTKTIVLQVSDDVDLRNAETTTVSGQTLVPVRSVAEAMGARVAWDVKAGLLTITGAAGTAELKLGDTSAVINGSRVNYPVAPFMHHGRFYAPLGFFQHYFNMGLIWDPYRQAYRWVWILPPQPYPAPPVIYGEGSRDLSPEAQSRRVGEVVRIQPSRTRPTVTVSIGNREVTLSVSPDAVLLRGRVGGRSSEIPLSEIRRGDRVTMQLDEAGMVTSLRAQYQEVRGVVQSIRDDRVTLDTGRALKITDATRIVLPGNSRGRLQDLSVGDQVIGSVGPISGDSYLISVQAAQQKEEQNLLLSTYGPISAGDLLHVTFRASAGGQALLTIPGLLAEAPMNETSPGVYEATYTVKTGDELLGLPVRVTFIRPDQSRFETLSVRPVTIVSESGYLPRITSPRNGTIIGSPLVVTGIANPGARVRVSIEFRRDIQGVMPIEGLSDVQNVRAGSDGVWKTEPMAATAPFHDLLTEFPIDFGDLEGLYDYEEYPTVFTITAAETGSDGSAVSSYSIETLRGRGTRVGL